MGRFGRKENVIKVNTMLEGVAKIYTPSFSSIL